VSDRVPFKPSDEAVALLRSSECSHSNRQIYEIETDGVDSYRPLRLRYRCQDCESHGTLVLEPDEQYIAPTTPTRVLDWIEHAIRRRGTRYGALDVADIREQGILQYEKSLRQQIEQKVRQEITRLDAFALENRLDEMLERSVARTRKQQIRRATQPRRLLANSSLLGLPKTIYALHRRGCPDNVRYVGQTSSPTQRFAAHMGGATQVSRWIAEEAAQGFVVDMTELEEVDAPAADLCERFWIGHYRDLGLADLNIAHTNAPRRIVPEADAQPNPQPVLNV
jgi:hypothetical protein